VLVLTAGALGVVVAGMSAVTSLAMLALAITLTRAIGQSALSVVSLTIVGKWFTSGLDRAMAAFSITMSVGFMIAFPLVGSLVQARGWRWAWLAIGLTIFVLVAPAGAWLPRSTSASADRAEHTAEPEWGMTWLQAVRTGAFWVFAIGAALYGLAASGIGLFNESILAERGFGPQVYYQSLVVTALTALAGNFLAGWWARRAPLTTLLATSLAVLAAGLIGLPHVTTFTHVMVWAAAMGLGGGLVMVLFFAVWPRVFGRRHLGRIQGAAQALTVLASAIGPVLLAWSVDRTGSYAGMFRILAATIAITALAALVVRVPARRA
jgi:MFS family permease